MAVIVLFALMLIVTLMRVYLPRGVKVTGKQKLEVKLNFIERLVLQRINLYAIGAVLFLMTVTQSIPSGLQLVVIVATQVILLIPVRTVVTSDGIALNHVLFRPWSDFAGFTVESRRITLMGAKGARPLHIPVLAEHQSELVTALGRHLPRIQARKEARSEHQVTVG